MEKLLQAAETAEVEQYRGLAEDLLAETDSVTLIAAALKLLTKEQDTTPVQLTPEEPVRSPRYNHAGPRREHKYEEHGYKMISKNRTGNRKKQSWSK